MPKVSLLQKNEVIATLADIGAVPSMVQSYDFQVPYSTPNASSYKILEVGLSLCLR